MLGYDTHHRTRDTHRHTAVFLLTLRDNNKKQVEGKLERGLKLQCTDAAGQPVLVQMLEVVMKQWTYELPDGGTALPPYWPTSTVVLPSSADIWAVSCRVSCVVRRASCRFEPGFRKSVNRALYNVAVEVSVPAHGYGVYTFRWVPIGATANANPVLERLLEEAKANEDKQPKEKERKADYHGEGDEDEEEPENSPEPEEARCALFQGLGRAVSCVCRVSCVCCIGCLARDSTQQRGPRRWPAQEKFVVGGGGNDRDSLVTRGAAA